MGICPNCNRANEDEARFCPQCGTKLNRRTEPPFGDGAPAQPAEIPGVPMDDTFTVTTPVKLVERSVIKSGDKAYPKRKKKGKVVLFSVLGTAVVLVAIAVALIAPTASYYFDGNSALESGNYKEAIDCYIQADGFWDSEEKLEEAHYSYAQEYFDDGDYYNAALHFAKVTDRADKVFECGEKLSEDGDYDLAREVFLLAGTGESESASLFAEGMKLFKAGAYADAIAKFDSAGDYGSAKEMQNACYLLQAEEYAKKGDFANALVCYKKVPGQFAYGGIAAADRIATLENGSDIIALAGNWKPTYSHTRSGNSIMYWYHEKILSTVYMTIQCKMTDNGELSLAGTVYYPLLPKVDEMNESTVPTIMSETFNLDNVDAAPTKIALGDHANLTLNGSNYVFYYYKEDDAGNSKMTNVTFTKE